VTKPADQAHMHAIYHFSCFGSQIFNNTFTNLVGGCIDLKLQTSNCFVYQNYAFNCATATPANAVGVLTGSDGAQGDPNHPTLPSSTYHNNIIDGCGEAKSSDVNNTNEQDFVMFNNTVYDTRSGSQVGIDLRATSVAHMQFYNNIFQTTANTGGGGNGNLALSTSQWTNVNNNCYLFHTNSWQQAPSGSISSFVTWKASPGNPDAASLNVNPQFASAITSGNGPTQFQLAGGSPCLGAGQGGVNMGAWDGTVTQIGADWVSYPVA